MFSSISIWSRPRSLSFSSGCFRQACSWSSVLRRILSATSAVAITSKRKRKRATHLGRPPPWAAATDSRCAGGPSRGSPDARAQRDSAGGRRDCRSRHENEMADQRRPDWIWKAVSISDITIQRSGAHHHDQQSTTVKSIAPSRRRVYSARPVAAVDALFGTAAGRANVAFYFIGAQLPMALAAHCASCYWLPFDAELMQRRIETRLDMPHGSVRISGTKNNLRPQANVARPLSGVDATTPMVWFCGQRHFTRQHLGRSRGAASRPTSYWCQCHSFRTRLPMGISC